jgi:ABC-2 type transport system ATP-binding protein
MNDTAIRLRGVRKQYGDLTAVDGVDLDVETGEILAVLGPNGAGKTTTVEICEGHRDRDAGEVMVLGIDPARATDAWRARVGIVLQSTMFTDELTVRETVDWFGSLYPNRRDTDEVIDSVGLTERAAAKARTLSGGQKRRLDVAIGVVGRPELLFLDEPTTGFDPEARRQFWELIRGLRTDGTTIVLTTHYLDEAEALADRVAVLTRGRVLEVATPSTLGGRADSDTVVRWTEDGRHREQRTNHPTSLVVELASRFDGEVPDLVVTRPSLEDVYLQMIGALS